MVPQPARITEGNVIKEIGPVAERFSAEQGPRYTPICPGDADKVRQLGLIGISVS